MMTRSCKTNKRIVGRCLCTFSFVHIAFKRSKVTINLKSFTAAQVSYLHVTQLPLVNLTFTDMYVKKIPHMYHTFTYRVM